MSAIAINLLREVHEAGGSVQLAGERLRLSASTPLPEDLRTRLRQYKAGDRGAAVGSGACE